MCSWLVADQCTDPAPAAWVLGLEPPQSAGAPTAASRSAGGALFAIRQRVTRKPWCRAASGHDRRCLHPLRTLPMRLPPSLLHSARRPRSSLPLPPAAGDDRALVPCCQRSRQAAAIGRRCLGSAPSYNVCSSAQPRRDATMLPPSDGRSSFPTSCATSWQPCAQAASAGSQRGHAILCTQVILGGRRLLGRTCSLGLKTAAQRTAGPI